MPFIGQSSFYCLIFLQSNNSNKNILFDFCFLRDCFLSLFFFRFKLLFSIWIWLLCTWSKCDRKWCKWRMNECDIDINEWRNRERERENPIDFKIWLRFRNKIMHLHWRISYSFFHFNTIDVDEIAKEKKCRFKIRNGRNKTKFPWTRNRKSSNVIFEFMLLFALFYQFFKTSRIFSVTIFILISFHSRFLFVVIKVNKCQILIMVYSIFVMGAIHASKLPLKNANVE